MIRTVTALFEDTDEAEAAFDRLSRRLAILKGAIVTCGPGEKPDFGTIYLSRGQREACEDELQNGGSLVIVQIEGDKAAEQAVELLDRLAQGESSDSAPAPAAAPPAPVAPLARPAPAAAAPAPVAPLARPAPIAAVSKPAPIAATTPLPAESAFRISKGPAPDAAGDGVPVSSHGRRAAPAAPEPQREPEPETAPAAESQAAPTDDAQARIPLVEEELRVGKRSMVRGGARVHSYMEEVPVTKEIELTEERTSIERRPANRHLSEEEIVASGLLQDRVVEITQMREEAVVTKEAVVREELVVKKTIEKRVEQIHETIRRTAVEMERLEPELAGTDRGVRRD